MTDKEEHTSSGIGQRLTPEASRRKFLKGTGALAAAGAFGAHEVGAHGSYNPRVFGYFQRGADEDTTYGPADVPYSSLTHLSSFSLAPESDGTVVLSDSYQDDLLTEFMNYDDENTVFQLTVHDGYYNGNFSDAASTQTRRERFARTAVDHVVNYGFDGLDLDWEFPDGRIRDDDPQNFTALLAECRQELDDRMGAWTELSYAGAADESRIDTYEVDKHDNYVDFINVMTYNYHGQWSNDTNFNSPLYSPPEDPDGQQNWNASHSMEYWASKPIAKSKLVMGAPFYGWAYQGVSGTNKGLFQSFDSAGAVLYKDVDPSNYDYFWHHDAEVPWLYSWTNDEFISWVNEASVANKCSYVLDNGFGGAFCWELGHDTSNTLIAEMHEDLHNGHTNTKFHQQDHSVTTADLSVRECPSTDCTRLDVAPAGTTGTVTDGPVHNDGYVWYEIAYDDGVADGWSASDWLDPARFNMDHVAVTTTDLSVRDCPSTSCTRLDVAPGGTNGIIIDGPEYADGYTWWKVDYYGDVSTGWSAQGSDWLVWDY